ncbi:cullin-1, putative [Entamoeba dispar SAW760]|uniref:Cullin-1, putative n=1 Tax=Entamoeba dispar (strain ATCC PRA-260 / SAW760) TaxID=370354 RepID=B0ENC4_ENTDS|nr:cullin-1, putative [Entamoeba dispar SAW760]EDR24001.1 cullin-1, putative [Entamoeba dispar SAW760]|eukprot:EDR24001.1 cullin-1, putative [Entamoeba dispar SAW760]
MPPKKSKININENKLKENSDNKENIIKQKKNEDKYQIIDKSFEVLEPFFQKIEQRKGFGMKEAIIYHSEIFDLYIKLDTGVNEELNKYIKEKIEERLTKLFNYFSVFVMQESLDKFVSSLRDTLDLIKVVSPEIIRVFNSYDESVGINEQVTTLMKSKRIEFIKNIKDRMDIIDKLVEVWRLSRKGESVDISVVCDVLEFYKEYLPSLQEYQKMSKEFYDTFINKSIEEYKEISDLYYQSGLKKYLELFGSFYCEEKDRIKRGRISNTTEEILLKNLLKVIKKQENKVNSSIEEIVRDKNFSLIKRIDELYIENNEEIVLNNTVKSIKSLLLNMFIGKINLENIKESVELIVEIFNLWKQFFLCFNGQGKAKMENLFKEILIEQSNYLNDKDNVIIPSLFSRYINLIIRKNSMVCVDSDSVDSAIETVFKIGEFIVNKDIFCHFICKNFIERLILMNSNEENEEILMKHMRNFDRLGVMKMIKIQTEYNQSIGYSQQYLKEKNLNDFNCLVFGGLNVDLKDKYQMKIDPLTTERFESFTRFYIKKKPTQKLTMCLEKSSGIVKYEQKYFITATLPQIMILLLFNTHKVLKISEIALHLNLPSSFVKTAISGIIYKQVLCQNTNFIEDETQISINTNFNLKVRKISVMMVLKKLINQTQQEQIKKDENDENEILKLRENLLKCTIVRIMKHSKIMSCQQLIQQTITAVQKTFKAQVNIVRKVIEILIDQNFLMRDGQDIQYVA